MTADPVLAGSEARPLVIAHRGASGYRPENTLPAYALAVEQRADMIEIDLHLTRDGAIAITHDERLQHLGGQGEIADASLAELRRLDAGQGERIPTLDEVLDRFGREVPFNLELKTSTRGEYPGLEALALAAVESRGLLGATVFSSFSDRVLATLRGLSASARLAVLVSPRQPGDPFRRAAAVGAWAVNPWHGLVDAAWMAASRKAGKMVFPYTVDEPRRLRELVGLGVDGIFTNFPDRLRALLAGSR